MLSKFYCFSASMIPAPLPFELHTPCSLAFYSHSSGSLKPDAEAQSGANNTVQTPDSNQWQDYLSNKMMPVMLVVLGEWLESTNILSGPGQWPIVILMTTCATTVIFSALVHRVNGRLAHWWGMFNGGPTSSLYMINPKTPSKSFCLRHLCFGFRGKDYQIEGHKYINLKNILYRI